MLRLRLFSWPERASLHPSLLQVEVKSPGNHILTINCRAWKPCMPRKVSWCEGELEPVHSNPLRDYYGLPLKSISLITCNTWIGVMYIWDMYSSGILTSIIIAIRRQPLTRKLSELYHIHWVSHVRVKVVLDFSMFRVSFIHSIS